MYVLNIVNGTDADYKNVKVSVFNKDRILFAGNSVLTKWDYHDTMQHISQLYPKLIIIINDNENNRKVSFTNGIARISYKTRNMVLAESDR